VKEGENIDYFRHQEGAGEDSKREEVGWKGEFACGWDVEATSRGKRESDAIRRNKTYLEKENWRENRSGLGGK